MDFREVQIKIHFRSFLWTKKYIYKIKIMSFLPRIERTVALKVDCYPISDFHEIGNERYVVQNAIILPTELFV